MKHNIRQTEVNDKSCTNPFYAKPTNFFHLVLSKLTYWILLIYYALQSPTLPTKDKAKIIAALAYLILPLDLIPDTLPIVGILDDGAILFALFRLFMTIDDSLRAQAREKTRWWLGSNPLL